MDRPLVFYRQIYRVLCCVVGVRSVYVSNTKSCPVRFKEKIKVGAVESPFDESSLPWRINKKVRELVDTPLFQLYVLR